MNNYCYTKIAGCTCDCHKIGVATYKASNPPQACCNCVLHQLTAAPMPPFIDYVQKRLPPDEIRSIEIDALAEMVKMLRDEVEVLSKKVDNISYFLNI